jgi:hypothetical protein
MKITFAAIDIERHSKLSSVSRLCAVAPAAALARRFVSATL